MTSREDAPRMGIVMPLGEQRGGAELALLHYLGGLVAMQAPRPRLCFLESGPLVAQCRNLGFDCTVIEAGRLREPLRLLRTISALYQWMRAGRLQVVLSWLAKAHLYAAPAAVVARVPAVWWQHGLPTRSGLDQLATLLPARRILACSQAAARAQHALLGNRLDPVVIHPPVDLEGFRSQAASPLARSTLGLPEDALVVGIVARLQRWKGVHLVMEAVAALRPRWPQLRLLVVGGPHALEPGYPQELAALCERLDLQRQIVFLGQRGDVAACVAQMDVVVNASTREPFGMVIVEAMALGKAVVAARAAGPLEIITPGVDGLLFDPGSSASLEQALARLLADEPLRRRLGAAAHARAAAFGLPRFTCEVSAAVAGAVVP